MLVNDHWLHQFNYSSAIFLHPDISDHSPGLIQLGGNLPRKKKHVFKFCNIWVKDPQFEGLFWEAWSITVTGTPMYVLMHELKATKKLLKNLHRSKYTQLAAKVEACSKELHIVQEELSRTPLDPLLQEAEKELQNSYQSLVNAELQLLKQQAKVTWLQCNDANTYYFHSRVKERYSRHKITSIYTADGQLLTYIEQVHYEFLNFYDGILGQSSTVLPVQQEVIDRGPKLSAEQGNDLCNEVTEAEIDAAVFSIPR